MMMTVSTDQSGKQIVPLGPVFVLCYGLAAILLLALTLNFSPTADITWRLYVAEQMLSGKEIYKDVIETNPPLWFWSALPWIAIAKFLGASSYAVMVCGICLLIIPASICLNKVLEQSLPAFDRRLILSGFLFAVLVATLGETGQREQAFLIGATLWACLISARIERRSPPLWVVCTIAIFASYGFALKHYFIMVPIALEVVALAYLRRSYRPFRLETLIVAAAAIVYAVSAVGLAPEFFKRIVPLGLVAYGTFGPLMEYPLAARVLYLASKTAFVFAPLLIVLVARDFRKPVVCLLVTLIMSVVAIWVQAKGWRYHMLAAQGVAIVLAAIVLSYGLRRKRYVSTFLVGIITVLLAYLVVVKPIEHVRKTHGQPVYPWLRKFVGTIPQTSRITILSVAPEHAFYIVRVTGHPITQRHYGMWALIGLTQTKSDPDQENRRQLELARIRREYIEDIQCRPPEVVIEEWGLIRGPPRFTFNTLDYLRQDNAFSVWFDTFYERGEPLGRTMRIWRARANKPADRPCLQNP